MTLPTPALDAWTRRGDLKARDNLWVAACHERAAREATDPYHRAMLLERAREAMQEGRSWHMLYE